jgi:hypothetical protein
MAKHLAFWIGVFAASLLIVPIALGVWGSAQGFARDWASVIFIVITTLVVLLVLALALRGVILRGVLKRGEASIEDVAASLVAGVRAAAEKDAEAAAREADKLARVAVGWYAWSSFYRWVIASALGLLLAFASFTGTVLLFEQIRKLEEQTSVMRSQQELMDAQTRFMESQTARLEEQTEQARMQNEIMTLGLVSELRAQMMTSIRETGLRQYLSDLGIDGVDDAMLISGDPPESCGMGLSSTARIVSPAAPPVQLAIANLARDGMLADRVIEALEFLLKDTHGGVAFTALMVLDRIDWPVSGTVFIDGLAAHDVSLKNSYRLSFDNSLLMGFSCEQCALRATGSLLMSVSPTVRGLGNAQTFAPDRLKDYRRPGPVFLTESQPDADWAMELEVAGPLVQSGLRAFIDADEGAACDQLKRMAQNSRLFTMWE